MARPMLLCLLALFPSPTITALSTLSASRPTVPLSSRGKVISQRPAVPSATSAPAATTLSSRALVEEARVAGPPSGAIPFLAVNPTNSTLELNPQALDAIASLPAPVCVMSVAGAAHEGKSSLLNMFSHWLAAKWPTVQGAGADFPVASSLFDPGTDGAWLRVFSGKEGPIPGTECRSLALIDAPGAAATLSLDADASSTAGADTAAHRLFTLSTLASSTVALNIMSPILNQLHQLTPLVLNAKRALLQSFQEFTLADLPSLVVVARDTPNLNTPEAAPTPPSSSVAPPDHGAAHGAAAEWEAPLEQAQLEYAMLMPRGDGLDATKKALRTLFPLDRRLVQIGMPDERDRDALSQGQSPPAHVIPGLPLSGLRPFYASFDAAATATLGALRPKSLGGHALPGPVLAEALVTLVDQVNEDKPASLQRSVYSALDRQANEAVAAGVRSGIESLKDALLPALSRLPGSEAQAAAAAAATGERSQASSEGLAEGVRAEALTPAMLERTLANATERAYEAFLTVAPTFGAEGPGEVAGWLQPYASALLSEMRAIEREAHKAMQRARHFEAAVEQRVQQRLQAEARAQAQLASALHRREELSAARKRAAAGGSTASRRRRLLTGIALVFVSAGASACLPHAAIASLTPLAASLAAPIVSQGPTLLALVGVYRVAQRPVARAVHTAVSNVKSAVAKLGEGASALLRAAAAPEPAYAFA